MKSGEACSLSCDLGHLVLALPFSNYVTLAKLSDFSDLSFLFCKMKDLNFNE